MLMCGIDLKEKSLTFAKNVQCIFSHKFTR